MNTPLENALYPDFSHNLLLRALPGSQLDEWAPHLEWVELLVSRVLYEPGRVESHVYFPTSGMVTLFYRLENGNLAETAVVGNEGVVGISVFMGGHSTTGSAVVQGAGGAFRLKACFIEDAFRQPGPAMRLLLRYTQALLTLKSQTAVCNRHHALDAQLCRWLLLSLDRMPGGDLHMTQELIASMLGVRREGVTEAALKLQKAGLIRYARGHITVMDRAGLERRTCECYRVVQCEFARLLPQPAEAMAA
jgi:CRP-like cAMP-binding protein